MFRFLGNAIARYGVYLLPVWAGVLVLVWTFAPAWDDVTKVGEIASLPADAPSVQADQLYRNAFPMEYAPSSIVLVLSRADEPLRDEDRKLVQNEIVKGVGRIAAKDPEGLIGSVHSLAESRIGSLLVSENKRATLVVIELTAPVQDPRSYPIVGEVEAMVEQLRSGGTLPGGLDVAVTGSAVAGRDWQQAADVSARTIERWTIAIVIVLLLLLYRAPLVALIPLATVFIAVAITIPVLAWLTAAGVLPVFRDLRVFVTVLSYGAGVDYCLFLVARYREELHLTRDSRAAMARAIAGVGGAITVSALTVIGGIGMLAFARYAKIHQAGLIIPLALTIVLLAALLIGAALLRLAGRWAFWPHHVGVDAVTSPRGRFHRLLTADALSRFWERVGALLLRRPGEIWLASVILMAPFAVLAIRHADDINFNPLSELPADAPSAVGTRTLVEHFPPGALGQVVVLVQTDQVDFSKPEAIDSLKKLTKSLVQHKEELNLADVRSLAMPLGTSAGAKEALAKFHGTKKDVIGAVREEAESYYVSDEEDYAGHVTRIDLTLAADPLTRSGIASLVKLEEKLPDLLPPELANATLSIAGTTASLRDLSDVKRADERLVQFLVPGVVFLLLFLLLRRLVVSIYLILSVLLSYFATLGLTYLVFRYALGAEFVGLDWKVPIFLFTILVAVGEDYNIFLLTRVQEEQRHHGPLAAIGVGLTRTGRVISSCGFIMAGTFASLLSGSLRSMQELGFALTVGVLVDTLIVRPLLVPAFLVLLQRFFPGPWGRYLALGQWEKRAPASLSGDEASRHTVRST